MYIDKELELSNEQAVTSSAASTNYIDQGAAMDAGMGQQKHLAISVSVAATAAGAATVDFSIEKAGASDFSDKETVVSSGAIAKADLVAGKQIFIPLPPGLDGRYFRVYYTVATGPLTAGKFSAQIVEGIQKNVHYADAL